MELHLKSLYKIKEEWKKLYSLTPEVSPFLEYETLAIAWKYFYPYYITGRCLPKVAQFIDNGKTVALIPLTVRGDKAQLFGAPNGFNESGALFENAEIFYLNALESFIISSIQLSYSKSMREIHCPNYVLTDVAPLTMLL